MEDGEVASQIVVGSTGQVADVVGAVNIAAALGHSAVQTEERETPGTVTADVDGAEDETDIRGDWTGFEVDKSDFSQLIRETEEVDGTNHRTLETVSVDDNGLYTDVDNASAVLTELDAGDIEYEVSYNPGFEEQQEIRILGNPYTITEINHEDDELRLGSLEEHRNLAAGDSVEHGPWSFEIIDVDRDANEVRLDIYEDGEFDESATLGQEENATFGEEGEFRIDVVDVWFGDALDQVHIDTTYSDTTLREDDDESPFDAEWTVSAIEGGSDTVTSIALENRYSLAEDPSDDEDDMEQAALYDGDAFAGPADYFHVYNLGLTASDHEDVDFSEELEVDFADANHQDTSIDVTELTDADDLGDGEHEGVVGVGDGDGTYYPVEFEADVDEGADEAEVTVSYQDWEHTFDTLGANDDAVEASGWGFAVAVQTGDLDGTADQGLDIGGTDTGTDEGSFESGVDHIHTSFGAQVSMVTDAGEDNDQDGVEVDYETDDTITVAYDAEEEIDQVEYDSDNDGTADAISAGTTWTCRGCGRRRFHGSCSPSSTRPGRSKRWTGRISRRRTR
ncbi:hypothetical protein C446_08821 [Halobiforma nitratireducens JCM 10879]|uniref:S-layer protein outer domain-containing protein n=1 Tax=Halobiforma nitratireducens JCM 10879 TaxID=1227454 RepID=M0M3H6_9EURY|nr:hypothetical protein C446_08821 [Halobiforma nitratireducens JCM 10879]